MKVCQKCNNQLADNACFCGVCGTKVEKNDSFNSLSQNLEGQQQQLNQFVTPNYQQQPIYNQQFQPMPPADNRKTYSIMSYIGILWLFGLLASPEKFDKRVRFNVGQGIMASIVSVACSVIAAILSAIFNAIFTTEQTLWGYGTGYYETSATAGILSTLVWLIAVGISAFFMVYGIVKVSQNKDCYLPIIGKLAFYK